MLFANIANGQRPTVAHSDEQALRPFKDISGWGYINTNGAVAIKPNFRFAREFYEGRAAVGHQDGTGFIRTDGSLASMLPRGASWGTRFCEGRAWFCFNDLYGCIDRNGTTVIPCQFADARLFSEGLAAVRPDAKGRWRYVDLSGEFVTPHEYEYAGPFCDGLALVRRNGPADFEFIDRSGKVVLSLNRLVDDRRDFVGSVGDFAMGCVDVHIDGRSPSVPYAFWLEKSGAILGSKRYRGVSRFSDGRAVVQIGKQFGYADRTGRVTIPAKFDEAANFHEGLARVRIGATLQFIDGNGSVACKSPEAADVAWNDAEDFYGGLARIHIGGEFQETMGGPSWWKGGKWYYIDRQGRNVAICRTDTDEPPDSQFGRETAPP